jgi:flavin-dependent dehydrogenase
VSEPRVLVVGAGPAGSVAALVLARAGVRVRLVDRERFPRHKLCGDTLNPGTLSILDSLDASRPGAGRPPLGAAVRGAALGITGMTVTGPGGAQVTADYPDGFRGASLTRRALDLMLLDAAVAAGASFEDGVRVQTLEWTGDARVAGARAAGRSGHHLLPATIVVAADGRASRLAAAARLSAFGTSPRRWAFGAYFSDVAGVESRGEMHVRPQGYVGIAPLPDGSVNVCVVRAFDGRRDRCHDARRLIDDAIGADVLLRSRFTNARRLTPVTTLGPLAVDSRGAGMPGLLLAGDAAGFIDPMTGDGLRFALRGGVLAAQAVLEELSSGQPAHGWLQAARVSEFGGKWRINRALRALSGSPAAIGAAAHLASVWQSPVRALVGIAGDIGLARANMAPKAGTSGASQRLEGPPLAAHMNHRR